MAIKTPTKRIAAGTKHDPTFKFSDLTIDDVTYKLCFSFNSMAIAEPLTGVNLLHGLFGFPTNMNAVQMRGLLFASMLVAQPETTLEFAGSLIRFETLPAVIEAISKAYEVSMPEQKKTAEPNGEAEPVS